MLQAYLAAHTVAAVQNLEIHRRGAVKTSIYELSSAGQNGRKSESSGARGPARTFKLTVTGEVGSTCRGCSDLLVCCDVYTPILCLRRFIRLVARVDREVGARLVSTAVRIASMETDTALRVVIS